MANQFFIRDLRATCDILMEAGSEVVWCMGEKKGMSRQRVGFKLESQTCKGGRANPARGISAIPALGQNQASLVILVYSNLECDDKSIRP